MTRDRRLGRGLAALLGAPLEESPGASLNTATPTQPAGAHAAQPDTQSEAGPPDTGLQAGESASAVEVLPAGEASNDMLRLNVYEIDNNPFQPRRDFSESEIAALAASLQEHDILQPVVVRRVGDRYQLIAGERRLRAAIQLGWSTIPARVRDADDRLAAELAIVENLKRQDLNPIEKALSFKRYLEQHQCTQEELAGRLKIDRSTIANLVRLLELPEEVTGALRKGVITAGHARALLPLGDERLQVEFCQRIRGEGHSVRETERLVQAKIDEEDGQPFSVVGADPPTAKPSKNEQVALLEQELRHALGTKVEIRQTKRGRGKIIIQFSGHEQFEQLREILTDRGPTDLKVHTG